MGIQNKDFSFAHPQSTSSAENVYMQPDLPRRPEYFNFVTDVVDKWAKEYPHNVAMLWVSHDMDYHRSLTFQHFSFRSRQVAHLMKQLGIKKGDVVVILLPKVVAWWEIALAALLSGIILAPIPSIMSENDLQYRCSKSKASTFIGDENAVRKFRKISQGCPTVKTILQVGGSPSKDIVSYYTALEKIPQGTVFESKSLPWNHPSFLYFTSGTSGPPKMVVHNQISFPLALSNTGQHWLRLKPHKLFWNIADQGWAKASYSFFGAWNCGAALFLFDDRQSFDANRLLKALHTFPVTHICAPPLAWRQLTLRTAREYYQLYPPKALEHCTAGGEALSSEVIKQWSQVSNLSIHDGYGQTETILLCGNLKGCPIRPGSMGKPLPGIPLGIIDACGKECAPNTEGNIAVKLGTSGEPDMFFGIFDGYVQDDGSISRTEHTFTVDGKKETWYITGDRGRRDEDGYFWFVGRGDDVINSAGYRIGPFEVESTLKQHPAVAESAVVSSPDPSRGEVVKAFVVLTPDFMETGKRDLETLRKELQLFCKLNAAPYKYPRKIQFVTQDFLPKTVSGKIQRNLLRKMEWKDQKSKV